MDGSMDGWRFVRRDFDEGGLDHYYWMSSGKLFHRSLKHVLRRGYCYWIMAQQEGMGGARPPVGPASVWSLNILSSFLPLHLLMLMLT